MMNISNQTLYQEITDKLKTVPKEVLERISAYLSEIDENKDNLNFELSEEQKKVFPKIKERPYSEHTEVNISSKK
jgi:gas vesicle protein